MMIGPHYYLLCMKIKYYDDQWMMRGRVAVKRLAIGNSLEESFTVSGSLSANGLSEANTMSDQVGTIAMMSGPNSQHLTDQSHETLVS